MATYEYKCTNKKCKEFNSIKVTQMSIKDYSEDKLPKCENCDEKTSRHYSTFAHQTFGDGYKG